MDNAAFRVLIDDVGLVSGVLSLMSSSEVNFIPATTRLKIEI